MTKKWYQSVTIWTVTLGTLSEILLLVTQTLPINQETMTWLVFINGVIGIVLRTITNKGITV